MNDAPVALDAIGAAFTEARIIDSRGVIEMRDVLKTTEDKDRSNEESELSRVEAESLSHVFVAERSISVGEGWSH